MSPRSSSIRLLKSGRQVLDDDECHPCDLGQVVEKCNALITKSLATHQALQVTEVEVMPGKPLLQPLPGPAAQQGVEDSQFAGRPTYGKDLLGLDWRTHQQIVNCSDEFNAIDGLCEVTRIAGIQRKAPVLGTCEGRHRDGRHLATGRTRATQ